MLSLLMYGHYIRSLMNSILSHFDYATSDNTKIKDD